MKGTGAPRSDAPVENGTPAAALSHQPIRHRVREQVHGFTFIDPVPLTPAIVAVIVTVPAAKPLITPVLPVATPRLSVLVTFATLVSLLVQIVCAATRVSPIAF